MDGPIYRDALGALGIEAVVPAADDAATVDRIIFDELVDGVFTTIAPGLPRRDRPAGGAGV